MSTVALETVELDLGGTKCRTAIVSPQQGSGPWPAILLCFDAGGLRPTMYEMAQHIANWGYVVAIPDLYAGVGDPFDLLPVGTPRSMQSMWGIFGDDTLRGKFFKDYYIPAVANDHLRAIGDAVLANLATRGTVKPGKIGVIGYCMGGNATFRIATLFGDRVAAAASFHPGFLVTGAPDSPHTKVAAIDKSARIYVGAAANDGSLTDEQRETLKAALDAVGIKNEVVHYPYGHGFAVPDNTGPYDAAASQQHYAAARQLFSETLS